MKNDPDGCLVWAIMIAAIIGAGVYFVAGWLFDQLHF